MEALRSGFCHVFPLSKLRAFTPSEVRVMLCGDQNPQWSRDDLLNYTEPKLGYTKDRLVTTFHYLNIYIFIHIRVILFQFRLYILLSDYNIIKD